MGDTHGNIEIKKWSKATKIWASVVGACLVVGTVFAAVNGAFEFVGHVSDASELVVGTDSSTTSVTIGGSVLEEAITTLTVDPPTFAGALNEVPPLEVTINRLNRPLAGGALVVGGTVCRKAINLDVGSGDPIECDVPGPVLDAAVVAATEVEVRLTAIDGTDVSVSVPLDLSPARCADPRTPSAEGSRLTAEDLVTRWTWVLTDPASPGCESWDDPWTLDEQAWTTTPDGWIEQIFDTSSIRFQVSGRDEILTLVVTLYKDDVDQLDDVNTSISAVFSTDVAEMNALLDLGLNRPCGAGVGYAISETADDLATTITVKACND